eukprot:TRINITY_DN19924_c0_g2_i1.p1 TRINITY_DN19924_c0_g2~~TRINITY_DN19924_c0_g2_i1.p1  ORF type:complete len:789 (+),score=119.89 TRINITY_DN19924_c0_g2_i1:50-2368(+)
MSHLPPEVSLPQEVNRQFEYTKHKCYAYYNVEKENAGGGRVPRALVLFEKYVTQVKAGGQIARFLLLSDIIRVEYGREVNKVLIVTKDGERDWLFTWKEHLLNTPGKPQEVLSALASLWKVLNPQHTPLEILDKLNSIPDTSEKPGSKTPKDLLLYYKNNPTALPKSYEPPKEQPNVHQHQHQQQHHDTNPEKVEEKEVTFTISLKHVKEELGAGICETPDGSVEIRALTRDGCLARHNIPLGVVVEVAGMRITGEDHLRFVKSQLEKAGKMKFDMKMTNCEWGVTKFTDELSDELYSNTSDRYTYTLDEAKKTMIPGAAKAVLIGLSYHDTDVTLPGAGKRVTAVSEFLRDRGYSRQKVLCDDIRGAIRPSKANILRALEWLSKDITSADNTFLYITGHSTNIPDDRNIEGGDVAAFAPLDYVENGFITCPEVNNLLLFPLPRDSRIFILCDFSLGGTLVDLAFKIMILADGDYEVGENVVEEMQAQAVLVTMLAAKEAFTLPVGLVTSIFIKCFFESSDPTFQTILDSMREQVGPIDQGGLLFPYLACTRRFDARGERFSDPAKGMVIIPPQLNTSQRSLQSRRSSLITNSDDRLSKRTIEQLQQQEPERKNLPLPQWLLGEHEGRDFLTETLPNRRSRRKHIGGSGGGGGAGKSVKPPVRVEYRERLIAYYRYHNPEMLHKVSSMLIQYKGKEEQLFSGLVSIYGEEPHNIPHLTLPPGWTKVQSPQGDVFYRNDYDGRRQWDIPQPDAPRNIHPSELPPPPGFRPPRV